MKLGADYCCAWTQDATPVEEAALMKILRLPQVIEVTGLSRMTIYRKEAQGEFPKRRRLGRNAVGWVEEEVENWIQSRPEAGEPKSAVATFNSLPTP
jgi:prophage regulatory protein